MGVDLNSLTIFKVYLQKCTSSKKSFYSDLFLCALVTQTLQTRMKNNIAIAQLCNDSEA